jgi:hypothetical protein
VSVTNKERLESLYGKTVRCKGEAYEWAEGRVGQVTATLYQYESDGSSIFAVYFGPGQLITFTLAEEQISGEAFGLNDFEVLEEIPVEPNVIARAIMATMEAKSHKAGENNGSLLV